MSREVLTAPARRPPIPRRELLTLLAYLEAGSHKAAAHRLGIAESTCRQRISLLIRRVGVTSAAQAVWALRQELEAEVGVQVRHRATQRRGQRASSRLFGTPQA